MSADPAVLYDLRRLRAEPPRAPFYAVIGHPVGHSRSPVMQQAALDALGIDARYIALDVKPQELAEALDLLPSLGARGCNVTVPHKVAAYNWIHFNGGTLDLSALEAVAVNTVAWTPTGTIGNSTDGLGWEEALKDTFSLSLEGLRILILGAGGAGQTVAFHALRKGAHVSLSNRSPAKSALVVTAAWEGGIGKIGFVPWEAEAIAEAIAVSDLIVNATSLSLGGAPFPFGPKVFTAGKAYYDLAYADAPTPFLRAATAAGGRTADGLSMLLHQGLLAFKIWHPALSAAQADRALAAMRAALAS